MAKSLFWLSDEAWGALSPHLPRGRPGKPRVDDRTVISGILHVLKTGCRWRDVPPVYGPPTTIYNRYNRWSQRRVWQRIFEKMAAAGPASPLRLDQIAGGQRGSKCQILSTSRQRAQPPLTEGEKPRYG
jgi:transposase